MDPRLNRRAPPRPRPRPQPDPSRLAERGMLAWAEWRARLEQSAWPNLSQTGRVARLAVVGLNLDGKARSRPGAPRVPWPAESRSRGNYGAVKLAPGGWGLDVDRLLRWMDEAGAYPAAEVLRAQALRPDETQGALAEAIGLRLRTFERRLAGGRRLLGMLLVLDRGKERKN